MHRSERQKIEVLKSREYHVCIKSQVLFDGQKPYTFNIKTISKVMTIINRDVVIKPIKSEKGIRISRRYVPKTDNS